jgi:hypothetical protein
MPPRSRREAPLAYETLSIEGGLLSPEWLPRVGQLTAGHQAEADYGVPRGLGLRDEIARYWRIAHAHWQEFAAGLGTPVQSREDEVRRRKLAGRFVQALLRDCFGFSAIGPVDDVVIDSRRYPIGFAALDGRVPVVVAPAGGGVETASPDYGDDHRRRSPFGLAQEFLNASVDATWGMVSDGATLRILRDNASLTRPAWIEADLSRIFTENRYADFTALWLLAHASRFVVRPDEGGTPTCLLDTWRSAGQGEGTRAREKLRDGFRDALLALGQGFLSHPDNTAIRAALAAGTLTRAGYFQQLLRLVYRLIFLLTVEERELLHPPDTASDARELYAGGYSLQRLRDRSLRRSAHDRFSDLWAAATIVFRGLAAGEPRLGLPALAGIFAPAQCPDLDAARLANHALLQAVFRLTWLKQAAGLVRVNWRDMGPEELGSVYESLLELEPRIADEGRTFAFAQAGEARGNARRTTGSYYTPDSLVQVLLDSALEPVVADTVAKHPDAPVDAILQLSVVDPACGSGHFLLAAARRLAGQVARLQVEGTPSAADYRHALRLVIGRCIYGVDMNPMAVELCKVSLWMEAVEPGLPLTFLDSHIQCGNALLGTTPELMERGVPDAAWEPIEGDDRRVASALRRRNRQETAGFQALPFGEPDSAEQEAQVVAGAVAALEAASDTDAGAVAHKAAAWEGILESAAYRHQKFVADSWCAAFVWPKQAGDIADAAPTHGQWSRIQRGEGQPSALLTNIVETLATEYRLFHWHLQFPQVFARGGFDIVVGNPPWERVKLQEQEFFASRDEAIATAPNAAARRRLIARLAETDERLFAEFGAARRRSEGMSHFLRESALYPLTGVGDINTYQVFAEQDRTLLSGSGRLGVILPTGIATDATTAPFFRDLVEKEAIVSLYDFENAKPLFDGVHRSFKFCLLTLSGRHRRVAAATFAFFAHDPADLDKPDVRFSLTPEEITLLNPNTGTCPVFRSRRDAEITIGIYRRVPVLINENDREGGNPWGISFMRMFDMSNDSPLFNTREDLERDGWVLNGNVFEPARRA